MGNHSIHIITNTNDALLLSNELQNFVSPSEILAPSLQPYWILAFIRNYGWSRKLAITVISVDGKPRLIAPLQRTDENSLIFLCDETADYNDFLFDSHNPDINLMRWFLEYWFSNDVKKIQLDKLPHNSKSSVLLQTIAKEKKLTLTVESCDIMPVVITQADKPIDTWEGVKPKWVKGYQRSLRRLNKKADVVFSLIESQSELEVSLPIIRELHIKRWQSTNTVSKYLDKQRDRFIKEVSEEALEANSLFLPIMKINGVVAAYRIGFRGNNTIFDWNTSFSLGFSKWSPGSLLMLYILSNSKAWSFSKYNLLRGNERYKFVWTDRIEQTTSITISSGKAT